MVLTQNAIELMGIILSQRETKNLLPTSPKGAIHINVHFEKVLLKDKPDDAQR